MLNFDKYREKIEKLDGYLLPCGLAELRGFDFESCERTNCGSCVLNSLFWLVKKYEPPLLKNGDGLKPGDEIMVRDRECTPWGKSRFVGYFNRLFFVTTPIDDHAYGWRYARLPEKGE